MTLQNISFVRALSTGRSRIMMAALIAFNLSATAVQAQTLTAAGAIPDPAISLAQQDWQALSAYFHQPQFNITDGLDNYNKDYRALFAEPSPQRIAQNTVSKL